MEGDLPDAMEEKVRDGMVRHLRQNLARCRRVIMDQNMDLKTRERWTQTLQQHLASAQPGAERQTDARLGEKTTRNRRVQKEPEKG